MTIPETDTKFAEFIAVKICDKSETIEEAIAEMELSVPEGRMCGNVSMRSLVVQFINENQKFISE